MNTATPDNQSEPSSAPAPTPRTPGSLHEPIDSDPAPPSTLRFLFFGADGLRAGWSLLLFATLVSLLLKACFTVVHTAASTPHDGSPIPPAVMILREGLSLLSIGLATWILSRVERRPLRSYGIGRTTGAARQFVTGLGWGLVLLSTLIGLLWFTHRLAFDGVLLSGAPAIRFAGEWAFGFLLVALLEESTLRGFVQFTLSRGVAGVVRSTSDSTRAGAIGFWIAAVLLSFLFGLGHGSNPGESPIGLLSAGLAGLVFCLSLWRTGSLWWAIGFHATWDWAQSFFYGVADSGTLVQSHLLASHPVGRPLLSGGTTGPEGSVLIVPVMFAIAAVILLTLPVARRASTPA